MSNFDIVSICFAVAWLIAFIVVACKKERGATMDWGWYLGIPVFIRSLRKCTEVEVFNVILVDILCWLAGAVLVVLIVIRVVQWTVLRKHGKNVSVSSAQKESGK